MDGGRRWRTATVAEMVNRELDGYMVDSLLTSLKDFVAKGHLFQAFQTFTLLQCHSSSSYCISSDLILHSISSLLISCTNLKSLSQGKQLHAYIISSGFEEHPILVPKLITFYSTFNLFADAHVITETSKILHPLPWNLLISSYVRKGLSGGALSTYRQMVNKGIRADNFTFPSVLKACGQEQNMDFGRVVHKFIDASCLECLFVQNALVSMYGACGEVDYARKLFDKMPEKDAVTWNSMISGYASKGMWGEAFELFEGMRMEGIELNIITWNTIAGGCLKTGNYIWALELLSQMVTCGILLHSSQLGDRFFIMVATAATSAFFPVASPPPDSGAKTSSKLGGPPANVDARGIKSKSAATGGLQVKANAQAPSKVNGTKVGVMEGLKSEDDSPSLHQRTFINQLFTHVGQCYSCKFVFLSREVMMRFVNYLKWFELECISSEKECAACSHSGLVIQGQMLFKKMLHVYGLTPRLEHYACMVDLFGRAGLLKKAKGIITRMPYQPSAAMWATLIGACCIHGNTEIGEWAAEKLLEMRPENSGYYVLIANMYAAAGCWNKLARVRTFVRDLGVRKAPGCAWVAVGSGFSPFLVGDTSNPQAHEIYPLLGGLIKQMKDAGYVVAEDVDLDNEFEQYNQQQYFWNSLFKACRRLPHYTLLNGSSVLVALQILCQIQVQRQNLGPVSPQ
ncbi:unnamed protein product [Camellia sinensis]